MRQQLWCVFDAPPGYTIGSFGALLVDKLRETYGPWAKFELRGQEGDAARHIVFTIVPGNPLRLYDSAHEFCRGFAAAYGVKG